MLQIRRNLIRIGLCLCALVSLASCSRHRLNLLGTRELEVVAELDVTPGNMTISRDGRMFATVHGLRRGPAQLIEITGRTTWKSWPTKGWNRTPGKATDVLNSPLGVVVDHRDWLWVIDSGNFLAKPLPPKVVAFDVKTGALKFRLDFPKAVAPRGSLLQDLAVSPDGRYLYIADSGGTSRPGIVVVDTKTRSAYRYDSMKRFNAEDKDLVVRGKTLTITGPKGKLAPARLGVNPITLSADGATVFFGAMNGTTWYGVPTKLLNQKRSREEVNTGIFEVGEKPLSDGATTDLLGNHYFTAVTEDAIVRLGSDGRLRTLVSDPRLEWPDSVRFGPEGYVYIAVNQLNRTVALSGTSVPKGKDVRGSDTGMPPYLIMRLQVGAEGPVGR
jgi:sugar lactone lactonase YvrE